VKIKSNSSQSIVTLNPVVPHDEEDGCCEGESEGHHHHHHDGHSHGHAHDEGEEDHEADGDEEATMVLEPSISPMSSSDFNQNLFGKKSLVSSLFEFRSLSLSLSLSRMST
jgi:ABC-type Zn2+ transport system substrate-binding protein/surface adhesin